MSSNRGRGQGGHCSASDIRRNLTPSQQQQRRQEQFGQMRGRISAECPLKIQRELEEFKRNERLNRQREKERQQRQLLFDERRRNDAIEAYASIEEELKKIGELTKVREAYERRRFKKLPKPNFKKYKEMAEKEAEYQSRKIYSCMESLRQKERVREAVALTKSIQKRAIDRVASLLDRRKTEAIKNNPELLPGMKGLLKVIVYEDLRQWMAYEFEFENECPFCNLKYLKVEMAREHIDKHLLNFTEKAVEEHFQM